MSAQANITAFDGAATPVTHTFVPASNSVQQDGSWMATWRDSNSGLPLDALTTITQKGVKQKNGMWRVETNVDVPIMESVSGQNALGYTAAPKVAYHVRCAFVTTAPGRASIAELRLARQTLVNIMGNISTSVAAATAGPASELHDSRIYAS